LVAQTLPLKIDLPQVTGKAERTSFVVPNDLVTDETSSRGDVIQREVTVFSSVKHGPGTIVTGWKYSNGSAGVPSAQYCYYTYSNADHSSTRIDIAQNNVPIPLALFSSVPELEDANNKCQWYNANR